MASTAIKTKTKKQPGHHATTPWEMPWAAWKQILVRTWRAAGVDNVGLVAAGVAFYGFLALVPMLGAFVLSYGLIADTATVIANMQSFTAVMPADAAKLIAEQLLNVVQTSADKKGIGLIIALGIALYGAMSGASAIITALNIAYEEKEGRSMVRVYLLALTVTVVAVLVAILSTVAIAALAALEKLFPFAPGVVLVLGKIISYTLLVLAGAAGAATLYRYGPDRRKAKWVWITPGSVGSALLWLLLTIAFGIYVSQFGNYNATYGSLGAVVVLLTWLYLSSYILLLGAELNAEFERQTSKDTTEGPPLPPGERGAAVANQIASGTEQPKAEGGTSPLSDKPTATAAPPPAPLPVRSTPRFPSDFVASKIARRIAGYAGVRKLPMAPALLTTAGLSLLRREGRGGIGAVLLIGGGVLAWRQRKPVAGETSRRNS